MAWHGMAVSPRHGVSLFGLGFVGGGSSFEPSQEKLPVSPTWLRVLYVFLALAYRRNVDQTAPTNVSEVILFG